MYKFEIQGFIIFPEGFEKNLKQLNGADVKLYLNTTQFLPSNNLNKAVQKVLLTISAGIRIKAFEAKGLDPKHAYELAMPLNAEIKPISNPTNNYGDFLLPGLFLLILQQTLLIGLGESISHNREHNKFAGTIKQNGIINFLIGKSAFYIILYISYFVLLYSGIFDFFQINIHGSIFALTTISVLFLFSTLFFTYFIASFFKNPLIYMEIMAFTSYPVFLTTGYSWPVSAMPLFIQWISYILPTSPAMSAIIKITQLNANLNDISFEFINLLILTTISFIAVIIRLNYLKKYAAK
jgi:ABC-2 type transport system permease protein